MFTTCDAQKDEELDDRLCNLSQKNYDPLTPNRDPLSSSSATASTVQPAALGPDPSSPSVVASRGANARLSREDIADLLEIDACSCPDSRCFRRDPQREPGRHWIAPQAPGRPSTRASRHSPLRRAMWTQRPRDATNRRTSDGRRGASDDRQKPEDAARTLASRPSVACIRLGEHGALGATGDQVERRPSSCCTAVAVWSRRARSVQHFSSLWLRAHHWVARSTSLAKQVPA